MKIFVACEYSGIVRDAFENMGWDAWSCDLQPTESVQTLFSNKHIQGDVIKLIRSSWLKKYKFDLVVGFPPCTYLSYAGMSHWNKPGRIKKRLEALEFFRKLYELPVKHICLENPKSCVSPVIAKYTQIIQPYYFGDNCLKTTCLWLKNLPLLEYHAEKTLFNNDITVVKSCYYHANCGSRSTAKMKDVVYKGTSNSKERSRTFHGIANAMAEQWTEYLKNL